MACYDEGRLGWNPLREIRLTYFEFNARQREQPRSDFVELPDVLVMEEEPTDETLAKYVVPWLQSLNGHDPKVV